MVLEAKRIFTYDAELSTKELRDMYDIRYHDVYFWFMVMYKEQYNECKSGIENLFLL